MVEVQARSKFPLNAITFPKLEQAKNIFIYAKKAFTTSDGNATHTIASVSFPVLAEAEKIAIAYKKTHHGVLGPVNVATDSVLKKLKLEIKPSNSGNGTIGKESTVRKPLLFSSRTHSRTHSHTHSHTHTPPFSSTFLYLLSPSLILSHTFFFFSPNDF